MKANPSTGGGGRRDLVYAGGICGTAKASSQEERKGNANSLESRLMADPLHTSSISPLLKAQERARRGAEF